MLDCSPGTKAEPSARQSRYRALAACSNSRHVQNVFSRTVLVASAHGKHTKSARKRQKKQTKKKTHNLSPPPKVHCSLKEKLPLLSFPPAFHFSPKKINLRLARYVKCTACVRARKEECACCESGWSSDEHLLCPPFILPSLPRSPSLLSLLRLLLI